MGCLEDDAARGLELLAEEPMANIIEVVLPEDRVSVRLTGAQLDCRPRFEGGELIQLELTSRCSVQLCQWQREPTAREMEAIQAQVEEQLGHQIRQAMVRLRAWKADCVGLDSRVSIAAPWHWDGLEENWQDVFSQVEWSLKVEAALGR